MQRSCASTIGLKRLLLPLAATAGGDLTEAAMHRQFWRTVWLSPCWRWFLRTLIGSLLLLLHFLSPKTPASHTTPANAAESTNDSNRFCEPSRFKT
jgi:hypothetical protein